MEVCSENIDTNRLYCQTGANVIIINRKTFQIESIYDTFHFLFYPLTNTKYDLMSSYFEKINYNTSKLSNCMLLRGYNDIFQISNHIFLIATPINYFAIKWNNYCKLK